jgi:allantoinase
VTLGPEYLAYPRRRRGMDHDRYAWATAPERTPVRWPGGARIALMVVLPLQWFPLDAPAGPVQPVGALDGPHPDYRGYTHRDYGNRVGAFRLFELLERLRLRATVPANAAVCSRYPPLLEAVVARGWEVVGHGIHMGCLHHAGLAEPEERSLIDQALDAVRRVTGRPARGWVSPAGAESPRTLDLLAAAGVEYVGDWANDERPFPIRAGGKALWNVPFPHELSDATLVWERHHTTREFVQQIADAHGVLAGEASAGDGRLLAVALHPWISGQPHRVRLLEAALTELSASPGIWSATAAEVLDAVQGQTGAPSPVGPP